MPPTGKDQAKRCCSTSRAVRRPPSTSPSSWCGISSPTSRRPAMVDPIKQVFLDTDGDLKAVALALLDLPEAWSTPLEQDPHALRNDDRAVPRARRALQPPTIAGCFPSRSTRCATWRGKRPRPKGYSDDTLTWLNPDAMRMRLDIAQFASWEFKRRLSTAMSSALARTAVRPRAVDRDADRIAAAQRRTSGIPTTTR